MKCLKNNPSVIYTIFKFSSVVRKIVYTINAVGLLNSITVSLTEKEVFVEKILILTSSFLTGYFFQKLSVYEELVKNLLYCKYG